MRKVLQQWIYAHSFEEQNTEVANKLNDFLLNNKRKQTNLLNYLWGEKIHGALESSLQQDEDFQKATRISNNEQDNLDTIGLSSKQTKAVDRVISANNAVGAEYGRVAYRQGFSDSLKLLSELHRLS